MGVNDNNNMENNIENSMDMTLMQSAQSGPSLVFGEEVPPAPAPEAAAAPFTQQKTEQMSMEAGLTDAEKRQVEDFARQIDITNTQAVLVYGAGTQKKLSEFTETALSNVRTKDMGEIGEMVSDLVSELKNFDVDEEEKGLLKIFHKQANKLDTMKTRYSKAETNVNTIVTELEKHQTVLLKDISMLDRMYDMNLNYFKELTMYIIAGNKRLAEARSTELARMQEKAQRSGLQEDAQAAKDFAEKCDRFEKKLHDLELTRVVAMQMGPQIRMIQNSDTVMSEKIQSTIVNTIPLWKSQMVIALGVEHANQAARAQREVSDMTNMLLKKNAEKLKAATIEAARESERGIVDIETLRHTNETLISTLDEMMSIQQEGKEKRKAAREELADIENQLKTKLLQMSGTLNR